MTNQSATPRKQRPGTEPPDMRLDVATVLVYLFVLASAIYCVGWFMLPQLVDSGAPEVPRRYETPVLLAFLAFVPPVVSLLIRTTPGCKPVRAMALSEATGLSILALTFTAILPPFSSLPLAP